MRKRTERPEPRILVCAGEPSGDQRLAEVISAFRRRHAGADFFGMAGPASRAAGADVTHDIAQTAVFGHAEALSKIFRFRRIMRELLSAWDERKPDCALLVDFGGFNLRLARALKRKGARVAYYISPQVWASRPGRVRWVRRYVDLMMVQYDFVRRFYASREVEATLVGHPLLDSVKAKTPRNEFRAGLGIDQNTTLIGLMPGSRVGETRRFGPLLSRVSENLRSAGFGRQLIIAAPGRSGQLDAAFGGGCLITDRDHYSAMAACDLIIMASGTAALEAAILGAPAVVFYKIAWPAYWLARLVMTVDLVSLPNIIAGQEIYPELIQGRCTAELITDEAVKILREPDGYAKMKQLLEGVRAQLGQPGAADRAAEHISTLIGLK